GTVKHGLRRPRIAPAAGGRVPLATVAKPNDKPTSLTVNHIAQLPAVIISFNLVPGVALGEAVNDIKAAAEEIGLPDYIGTSFEGSAHVFQQAGAHQSLLPFAALLVRYINLCIP